MSAFAPAPDASGNLLVQYSTARYPGVTALRPTADGMNDFGSLPGDGADDAQPRNRFGDSVAYDVDEDGIFEIVSIMRPCDPDCATGTAYFQTFQWAGQDFLADVCTLSTWPTVPIQATPRSGATVVASIPAATCGVRTNGYVEWDEGGQTEWTAVWYGDAAGWAPYEAFALPPSDPPWPDTYDPWSQDTVPTTTSPPTPPSCPSYTFNDQYPIRRCDQGYAVSMIQYALVDDGFALDADGYFGPGTEVAVRQFQASRGLEVDGLVGPNTWAALTGGYVVGDDIDGNGIIDPDEIIGD